MKLRLAFGLGAVGIQGIELRSRVVSFEGEIKKEFREMRLVMDRNCKATTSSNHKLNGKSERERWGRCLYQDRAKSSPVKGKRKAPDNRT